DPCLCARKVARKLYFVSVRSAHAEPNAFGERVALEEWPVGFDTRVASLRRERPFGFLARQRIEQASARRDRLTRRLAKRIDRSQNARRFDALARRTARGRREQ